MLDYVDENARNAMLELIFRDYEKHIKSKYMITPSHDNIMSWEAFRHDWIQTNVIQPHENLIVKRIKKEMKKIPKKAVKNGK